MRHAILAALACLSANTAHAQGATTEAAAVTEGLSTICAAFMLPATSGAKSHNDLTAAVKAAGWSEASGANYTRFAKAGAWGKAEVRIATAAGATRCMLVVTPDKVDPARNADASYTAAADFIAAKLPAAKQIKPRAPLANNPQMKEAQWLVDKVSVTVNEAPAATGRPIFQVNWMVRP